MHLKFLSFIYLLALVLFSHSACRDVDPPAPPIPDPSRVFVVNEGNFTQSNATLGIYNPGNNTYQPNVFQAVNGRDLGDVFQSITLYNDRAYLVVNNSGKVEVVDPQNLSSLGTISGLTSPRFFQPVSESKAYISDLASGFVMVVNPENLSKVDSIAIPYWTENMLLFDNRVYVSSPGSDKLFVIDALTDGILDSVQIGFGGNSLVLDQNGKLWVLCSGDFNTGAEGSLHRIDLASLTVEQSFDFSGGGFPGDLHIDEAGENLLFLDGGVLKKMPITAASLPGAFITNPNGSWYAFGLDPRNDDIYLSDALDFSQNGFIERYDFSGRKLNEARAEIIPGGFTFQ